MPKYLNLWEVDMSRMPTDQNERMATMKKMLEMTKQFLKEKPGSQWGMTLDGSQGFSMSSGAGTWQEMSMSMMAFVPYIKSKVYQVMSIEEAEELLKSMMQRKPV